jgi:3-hydroxyacyl-[acyl-carrier-protein] dehydratase
MNAVREQIRSSLSTETRAGGFTARFTLQPDFLLLPDHFPAQPIFPGICMLQAVLLAAAAARAVPELHLRRLKNSKLLQPVRPGDEMTIDADMTEGAGGELAIKARLSVAGQKRAEFSLVAASDIASVSLPTNIAPTAGAPA